MSRTCYLPHLDLVIEQGIILVWTDLQMDAHLNCTEYLITNGVVELQYRYQDGVSSEISLGETIL